MYLKNIELVNIGAYKGYNSFNFKTTKGKNVLLIGGENGAGKTTLLNAIKFGLFGSYGFGYKTENAEYFKHVESILNNQAKRKNNEDFSITIQFEVVDNLKLFKYELKREWKFVNSSIKEQVYLTENGDLLDTQSIELFNAKLKDIMPPQLLDFCLFDGEEIAQIVTQNALSSYIKQLSKVVFNLDLFETLELDLDAYSKQHIHATKMDSVEQELFEANNVEHQLRNDISTSIRAVEYTTNKLKNVSDEYLEIKSTFEKYGGLVKQERENILKQIAEIEAERKQRGEQIKGFVSTLLPFYLIPDLVNETREQIKNEESMQLSQQLDEKLSQETLNKLFSSLSIDSSDDQTEKVKKELISLIAPQQVETMIHGASFAESVKVEQVYNVIQKDEPSAFYALLQANQEDLKRLHQLKAKVNVHDSTDEFGQLLDQMDQYNIEMIKLKQKLDEEQLILENQKQELTALLEKIDKIKLQLRNFDKSTGSLLEAQKIITLSRRYRDIQIQQKLKDVQIQATQNLKKMLRKHDYISLIQINPENYEVTLLDAQQNALEKRTLSAGEKQILLLSIIWAIFKCSGRQVPFIFDTLLGRLDKTHKAAVLKTFIPNFGKQAIILATDSEIDEEHYNLLQPHISREYKLEFNPIKQQTKILKDYFTFS
ncbi:DNA sulfur modification protein DndD [Lysinibacillus fusiformis]|uniref:DNA sulfur modification protein DndD n=1 Tax=Lysinibacillus fusiformis TaxID=28031 RepID=UPI001882234F|nr:DNA sulfur modification protein DndD [Lysinibacillus fusiformis]MBD8522736.1 DNA sulfur modification protein DndD [Lysinibacillus fusiformis]